MIGSQSLFCYGIKDKDFYLETLQRFIKYPGLDKYAVNLSKLYRFSLEQLSELFELVDSGQYPVTIFDNLDLVGNWSI
jgi:hypothetical protein